VGPLFTELVWNSSSRSALIFRLLGLLLIAIGLQGASRRSTIVTAFGAVLAILAFTLTGHTSVNAHRVALARL
jgi:hypothetical protein